MKIVSVYQWMTMGAAGAVFSGTVLLGGLLAKRRWWVTLSALLAQLPILYLSVRWFYAAMGNYKTRLWGVAAIPFLLFVAVLLVQCRRNWRSGLRAVLLAMAAATVTVGLSLSYHILLTPNMIGLLQYCVYESAIAFAGTQICVAAVIYGLSWLIFAGRTPLFCKRICAVLLLLAGIGMGVFALVRGAVIGEMLGSGSRTVILLSFVAAGLYLIAVFYDLHKQKERSFEEQLLAEKARFEDARHNDAEAIWANVRKVRHDMKQNLTVLAGYLEDNEIEKCKDYLAHLLGNLDGMGNLLKSENRVLDYLINSKLCNLRDTEIVISGSVGDLSDIADRDLASIVGNLLDNAVEAVANVPEKRIELHFFLQNSNRILICKNTVSSPVLAVNPHLHSTKGGGTHLGLGTHIIRETVAKYNGMTDFFEDHGMFCVQIVLPIGIE